jgi:hypothetical protein
MMIIIILILNTFWHLNIIGEEYITTKKNMRKGYKKIKTILI